MIGRSKEVPEMKTNSSLKRIIWSLVYVGFALGGLYMTTGAESSQTQTPSGRARTVTKKPWRVEPVRIVAVKNKKRPNIEMGKPFDDDDDWLDGFTVTIKNNADQAVTAVSVDMVFRREPGDMRPPVAAPLNFGPPPMLPAYLRRNPNKIIKVGETADLELNSHNYKMLTDLLLRRGYLNGGERIDLVIRQVGFEDGSVLDSGTLWFRDPNNPNDPTKRIRVDKLEPAVRNHHASSSQVSRIVNSKIRGSLTRADSNLTPPHSSGCYEPEQPTLICCDQSEGCQCPTAIHDAKHSHVGRWASDVFLAVAN